MDTTEQIRQLEVSLTKEYEDLKTARKKVEIQQLEYDNKLKQLTAILSKVEIHNATTNG